MKVIKFMAKLTSAKLIREREILNGIRILNWRGVGRDNTYAIVETHHRYYILSD